MSKKAPGTNDRTLELIDKFIDRADRYVKDAEKRKDGIDVSCYDGQKKVLQELRDTLTGEWTHGPKEERIYGSGHPYN